ncbi:MAG: PaaI family thioesterase, partial [Myxococcota bacterium]
LTVDERHLQPFGILHGGIHCTLVETAASIGAWYAAGQDKQVVGAENHTSFLKPAQSGAVLTARATPVSIGRRAHLWQVDVKDQDEKLLASGRVRMFVLNP